MGSDRPRRMPDHLLTIGERHLQRVLQEYVSYYNHRRAHQGIGQRIPVPLSETRAAGIATRSTVDRRDVLGGVIHDYHLVDSRAA